MYETVSYNSLAHLKKILSLLSIYDTIKVVFELRKIVRIFIHEHLYIYIYILATLLISLTIMQNRAYADYIWTKHLPCKVMLKHRQKSEFSFLNVVSKVHTYMYSTLLIPLTIMQNRAYVDYIRNKTSAMHSHAETQAKILIFFSKYCFKSTYIHITNCTYYKAQRVGHKRYYNAQWGHNKSNILYNPVSGAWKIVPIIKLGEWGITNRTYYKDMWVEHNKSHLL